MRRGKIPVFAGYLARLLAELGARAVNKAIKLIAKKLETVKSLLWGVYITT